MLPGKLGRMAPLKHARKPLLMGAALLRAKAPDKVLRPTLNPGIQMYGNDRLSDCTAAGVGNQIHCFAATQGFDLNITQDDVFAIYEGTTDWTPAMADEQSPGAVETDVLGYLVKTGIKDALGETYHPLWGSAEPNDRNAQGLIINVFGASYGGFALSEADENAFGNNMPLDTKYPASFGDPTPGSSGGHCMLGYEYTGLEDDDLVTLITWGSRQYKATWRWMDQSQDEVHALAWRQLLRGGTDQVLNATWQHMLEQTEDYLKGQ